MTKPTTEELAAYLMEQSRIWSEGSHDQELLCAAAARLRGLERENAELRMERGTLKLSKEEYRGLIKRLWDEIEQEDS